MTTMCVCVNIWVNFQVKSDLQNTEINEIHNNRDWTEKKNLNKLLFSKRNHVVVRLNSDGASVKRYTLGTNSNNNCEFSGLLLDFSSESEIMYFYAQQNALMQFFFFFILLRCIHSLLFFSALLFQVVPFNTFTIGCDSEEKKEKKKCILLYTKRMELWRQSEVFDCIHSSLGTFFLFSACQVICIHNIQYMLVCDTLIGLYHIE